MSVIRSLSVMLVWVCSAAAGEHLPIVFGESFDLPSKVLAETRTALVALPEDYHTSNTAYPVLYLLDGGSHFFHTYGSGRFLGDNGLMPQMILVAITNTNRNRDLTPPLKPTPGQQVDPAATTGGADPFLAFLDEELIPYVTQHYRTRPYKILAGHSLGGLFAIHTLITKPDVFDAYVAVSPSLWWNDMETLGKAEKFFGENQNLAKRLFLSLGNEGDQMRKPFDGFTELLGNKAPSRLDWKAMILEDEDHGSVVLRSHYFAFKHIFSGWRLPAAVFESGLAAIKEHYQGLSQVFGYEIPTPERVINNLGYRYLARGETEPAIAAFRYNVVAYPDSANVYDSLAEAHEKAGEYQLAKKNYEKAVHRAESSGHRNLAVFRRNLERVSGLLSGSSPAEGTGKED